MAQLYTSSDNEMYVVISIPDNPILTTLGVFEGAKLTKKLTYKMGGPVLITISSREVAIGKDLSEQILVEKCEV